MMTRNWRLGVDESEMMVWSLEGWWLEIIVRNFSLSRKVDLINGVAEMTSSVRAFTSKSPKVLVGSKPQTLPCRIFPPAPYPPNQLRIKIPTLTLILILSVGFVDLWSCMRGVKKRGCSEGSSR